MTFTLQNSFAQYHSGVTTRLMKQEKDATPATKNLPSNQKILHPMEGYETSIERLQNWLVPGDKDLDHKEKHTQITQDLGYKSVLVTDEATRKELDAVKDIHWSVLMPLADREKDMKQQTLRKRLLTDSSIALIDPLVENPVAFMPEKDGSYTEEQLKRQNQLMDEQDKQLKQWQAQHVSFPYLGVPPVPAEKVLSLRGLKEAVTKERTTPVEDASEEEHVVEKHPEEKPKASTAKATKTRSGAVYMPVEIALNNTLHPVVLSETDQKKLAAVLLPKEKNLQNPLLPVQSHRDYHEGTSLILTGEDAYKKTVLTVNQPYFTQRVTPDEYAWRAFTQAEAQQSLVWSKEAIPLDVTPLLQNPLAFSDSRLEWLTPKQDKLIKERQKEAFLHQKNTLTYIKKDPKPVFEALNPNTTTTEVLSLQEAQTAVSKELKALPSVEKTLPSVEKAFWEPFSLYKPKAYQPIYDAFAVTLS